MLAASALLEHGADKNAVGLNGETAFGFVLERGVEAEIKDWIDLLGVGIPVPPSLVVRTIEEKISSDTSVVEMLLDAG